MRNLFIKQLGKGTKMMRMFLIFSFSQCLISLTSCSEQTDTVEEFPDWKNTNVKYFEQEYQKHVGIANAILPKWSLPEDATPSHTDCVLIDVYESGEGTTSPYLNDSVKIHYVGYLLPSTSYPQGYDFDKSYKGAFDPESAVPYESLVSGFLPGFATALLRMHRGDYWQVTIPYQLGYGEEGSGSAIPGYSTLIFEVRLEDFWSKKRGDRQ